MLCWSQNTSWLISTVPACGGGVQCEVQNKARDGSSPINLLLFLSGTQTDLVPYMCLNSGKQAPWLCYLCFLPTVLYIWDAHLLIVLNSCSWRTGHTSVRGCCHMAAPIITPGWRDSSGSLSCRSRALGWADKKCLLVALMDPQNPFKMNECPQQQHRRPFVRIDLMTNCGLRRDFVCVFLWGILPEPNKTSLSLIPISPLAVTKLYLTPLST